MQNYNYISQSAKKKLSVTILFFSKVDTVLTNLHGKYFAHSRCYFAKQIKVMKSSENQFYYKKEIFSVTVIVVG